MEWLLSRQLAEGGWPYDFSGKNPALGFLSTASSIAAASRYLTLLPISNPLKTNLKSAVRRAFKALKASQKNGAWTGDGSPPSHQILDAAFTLKLLMCADDSGILSSILQINDLAKDDIFSNFTQSSLEHGWPDKIGQNTPTGVSTISGLEAVLSIHLVDGNGGHLIHNAEKLVLAEWDSGALVTYMTSWDWQSLGLLAGLYSGPTPPEKQLQLMKPISMARSAWLQGAPLEKYLKKLPRNIFDAALFATTEGSNKSKNKTLLWFKGKLSAALDKSIENVIVWIILIIVGLIVAGFAFHESPREYLKNKISEATD
jgi:hypothetical protein